MKARHDARMHGFEERARVSASRKALAALCVLLVLCGVLGAAVLGSCALEYAERGGVSVVGFLEGYGALELLASALCALLFPGLAGLLLAMRPTRTRIAANAVVDAGWWACLALAALFLFSSGNVSMRELPLIAGAFALLAVAPAAHACCVFLCSRKAGISPAARRAGSIAPRTVRGREDGRRKESRAGLCATAALMTLPSWPRCL